MRLLFLCRLCLRGAYNIKPQDFTSQSGVSHTTPRKKRAMKILTALFAYFAFIFR